MTQLKLFCTPPDPKQKTHTESRAHWKLFIDGASRNNPGNSGAGMYLLKDGEVALRNGFYLGIRTNNEAEYIALLLGLFFVRKAFGPNDSLRVISDSLLVVQQTKGVYKVRKAELKPLHALAQKWMRECNAEVQHVLRTENVEADRMANQGINKKIPVPQEFINAVHKHGITW